VENRLQEAEYRARRERKKKKQRACNSMPIHITKHTSNYTNVIHAGEKGVRARNPSFTSLARALWALLRAIMKEFDLALAVMG
jgi:hypothetical protein